MSTPSYDSELRRSVSTECQPGGLPLVSGGQAATLIAHGEDYPGVVRAVGDLRADIGRVTGVEPATLVVGGTGGDTLPGEGGIARCESAVIIGTLGRSPLIDAMVSMGTLDVTGIAGRWETSLGQVVDDPMPGVSRALVVAGSDQRGTIFGIYDISRAIGVSPWYWWDDCPPQYRQALYVSPGRVTQGPPAVRYRGIFINDENPALGTWAPGYFGPGKAPGFPDGFNAAFYAKVFETLLRLRGNYVWPAVWGRAFAEDDPDNHATAKAYGVVLGSSHEAPMMRGIEEWNRHALPPVRDSEGVVVVAGSDPYGGNGQWSFRNNAEAIKAYWADGIRRMIAEGFEGTVALGMRGNGDLCLSDGDGIELMEEIIAVQRQILCEITGTDPAEIPQAWALYKEVQRYWDQGLRSPEDVTVILSDDNWGNLRKFPDPAAPKRAGGWGLYYHFDYVGDARNYKWVDTANLANVWDQLHQAYRYGVDRLWVVNVGDLKGQELPLSFFLDFAWDPERFTVDGLAGELGRWEREFALLHFGPDQAAEIADLLHTYGVLQSRRKPELLNRSISLDPDRDLATDPRAVVYDDQASPFSLTNYREMERVTGQWQRLAERAERCGTELPDAWRDAYYELVLYQVAATANLYALRQAEFTNLLYARQGRSATNDLADECDARFASDQAMSDYYNAVVAGGKWRGFQTQSKVGYGDVGRYGPEASWQQPEIDGVAIADEVFPPVKRIAVPEAASMAVAIDGSDLCWPGARVAAVLPAFSPFQTQPEQYIEVFNRGMTPFEVRLQPAVSWLRIEPETAAVDRQIRAVLRVDWSKAPRGKTIVPILVKGSEGSTIVVHAIVEHRDVAQRARRRRGHVEANGYVSTAADHPTAVIATPDACWKRIPDIGRTGSGMEPFPVTASRQNPPGVGPRLEYEMVLFTTGVVTVWVHASTRNDTLSNGGPRYAIAFDEGCPQPVDITADTGAQDLIMNRQWERNTSDNVNRTATRHVLSRPGTHVLKLWMVDPTIVVHHLVVDTGGMLASYLGPPESYRFEAKKDRE